MVAIQTPVSKPFRAWLEQFDPVPIVNRENGADRVALLVDDRDDEIVRRVYGNAVAVLGDTWNHRFLRERGDNALLGSSSFWCAIPEAYALIYQRDTVILRPVPDDAFVWEMIGAPCSEVSGSEWIMNGGLSLRNVGSMLEVAALSGGMGQVPEDAYFTRGLRQLGATLPSLWECARFAVETEPPEPVAPVGIHGTDKGYLTDESAWRYIRAARSERGV